MTAVWDGSVSPLRASVRSSVAHSLAVWGVTKVALAILFVLLASAPNVARGDGTEADPGANALDPDFKGGKEALERKEWSAAIASFSRARLRDPQNADIENYLGYAYRKRGEYELAFQHYGKALQLNPRHRGAHEYIGETYLIVGNLAKAEEHLAALRKICVIPCEELADLEKGIDQYQKRK